MRCVSRPNSRTADVIAAVRDHYGISVASLIFLALGADSATAAYRVEATDGAAYFLKTRSRQGFSPASVAVPRYLREHGVPHIFAPLLTMSKTPFVRVNDFALTLYRFIDGRIGGDVGMSDQQWVDLGRTLKQIHATEIPPQLIEIVPRETFVPPRRSVVTELEEAIRVPADSVQHDLAAFWKSSHDQIRALVSRADALGRRLREKSSPHVLCHADLHTRNILLEGTDQWWLVDWDETVLAPKERDLMFVVGGIARELIQPHDTEYFFSGYGDAPIDEDALAYYRYAWAVQDIGAYGEQVFFSPDLSEESRLHAVYSFKRLFDPGHIVSIAEADQTV
jgi:spectinomycin phosphotransferase